MLTATLVVTTKNRREDLRRALRSAVAQDAPLELLVIDDGSDDGTSEMVQEEFPQARLVRQPQSGGCIRRRNEGAALAQGDVIFSIDDDAEFSTSTIVQQTLQDFELDCIGAVAMPFVDVQKGPQVKQRALDSQGVYCAPSYIGTAHAIRREVFQACGGYRNEIFHQGEERDLCIRMLDRGYLVRAGRADPVFHYESPVRDTRRMDVYGRRNDILFAWHNVPWLPLPVHLFGTTFKGARYALSTPRPLRHAWGFCRGYGAIVRYAAQRRPVRPATYRLYRRLVHAGQLPLEQVQSQLATQPSA